jgi:hypothetical protein
MRRLVGWVMVLMLAGCAGQQGGGIGGDAEAMDQAAKDYVQLVLSVGQHDGDYVDAYYGPPEWREEVDAQPVGTSEILTRARAVHARVEALPVPERELEMLRHRYLLTQLGALIARVEILEGKRLRFDEESKALYDSVAPHNSDEHFQQILDELDPLLPGAGSLIERYKAWKDGFVIPPDRLDDVFQAAITACRERTSRYMELPPGESFEVEYVNDKSWSAYNWYKGGFHSLIQVNTDLPIYIDRAVDLACHEGYPGHHVYNALLEKHLVRDRGWVEFSVYPLFSPQSLIAEGTANYGIQVAFPGEERVRFERETLYPLAGLDPETAEVYDRVQRLVQKLNYAGNEAARRYLDGEIDAEQAAERLTRYALMAPDRARQRVRFMDQYRAYVINYNLGQDLVRAYIEGRSETPEERWEEFARLLSSPRLPSGLQ